MELWTQFSADDNACRISLPLLIRELVRDGRHQEARAVERLRPQMFAPGQDCRVVTGDEVDADEQELLGACAALDLATVRRHAYPVVFYEHVRSKLVHEYEFGLDGKATPRPMTWRTDPRVSYSNQSVKTDGETATGEDGADVVVRHRAVRRIHFHTAWLIELTRTLAINLDRALALKAAPLERPTWWLPDRQSRSRAQPGGAST